MIIKQGALLMKKIILLMALAVMLSAENNVVKVVFDLTTDSLPSFEQKVLKGIAMNKEHYEGRLKELEVAVVIHGGAYKFFVKEPGTSSFKDDKALIAAHAALKKRIASMAAIYNVKFLMCRSALARNKLKESDIYDFVTMLPNSTIGLIDKQNEGFAYIPIGK